MLQLSHLPPLDKEVVQLFWTMCSVLGEKPGYLTVLLIQLADTTVFILKMLVFVVLLHVSA